MSRRQVPLGFLCIDPLHFSDVIPLICFRVQKPPAAWVNYGLGQMGMGTLTTNLCLEMAMILIARHFYKLEEL